MDVVFLVTVAGFFPAEWSVRDRVPSPSRSQMMDSMQLLAAFLAVGLFVYLLFAMLCPERFS